ncbi:sigma 54-interacting transcriptional regulator [Desulfitobacterium sp.]|uniref:sigma 54-interacting transcriptional regulator n=1 Tax=Desulfitobacterium sp. TaxID=49981 RepID=UPI002B200534|nr:sigma 54-interacting transcriptional regulator [Desulfitobacterium sp.]MEA4901807.1 sigma 54-interacting transcriptional regulator [Desulfitobacterium sp.]
MRDIIFEDFPFGIICIDGNQQIIRKNKKSDQLLYPINERELFPLLLKLKDEQTSLWIGPNNQPLYFKFFSVEGSSHSLVLIGTEPDFTSNVPSFFERRIEDFPADPHGVTERIVGLISDAVTFERLDLLRIQPETQRFAYDYSIGINLERTVHTVFVKMNDKSGLSWIFNHETPHLVDDLGKVQNRLEDPLLFNTGFRSILRVPIVLGHGVVGAIMLASSEAGRFQLEDAFLIDQFSKLCAQAYFHSGLQLEYNSQKITATAFFQTTTALLDENNIKDFLIEYCDKLHNLSGMEHICIFLTDEKMKQRLCLAEAGKDSFAEGQWLPVPDSGMTEMFKTQAIVAFNIKSQAYTGGDQLLGKGFTSIIYSPIINNGKIVAALGGVSSDERALSPEIYYLFKSSSEQLNFVFKNDRLNQLRTPAPVKYRNCQAAHIGFQKIIGASPIMQETIRRAATAAQYEFPILITGETGTGKELFAKAIHQTSQVAKGPFIVVNSAAIPDNLLESELFGYQEGAFTGGLKGGKRGKVLLADGGTLFLDEIGELSTELQAKLLRVIQEQEVEPIGSTKPIPVHVRIISATHRNLKQMVQDGRFREDLLYRLNSIEIQLPPLRERGTDIIELAEHMLQELAKQHGVHPKTFSSEAREILMEYNWPGNVRQLQNLMNRLFVFVESKTIQPKDLTPDLRSALESTNETEKEKMKRLLNEFGGNKTALAQSLGITRTGLWKKLKRLELQ